MKFFVVGLGNRGEEYKETRHNVGFMAIDKFAKDFGIDNWVESAKNKGEVASGKLGKHELTLLKPGTMMNGSGNAVKTIVKSKKDAERLVVIHDDLDLGLGNFKIVYDRGSGGHRGVKSVQRALGTQAFVRIKVGVSPVTPSGKVKKPQGDKKILDFIVGDFRKPELLKIKKVLKDVSSAIESIILNGRQLAQTDWN